MGEPEEIARQMLAAEINREVQITQTQFRIKLVEEWNIQQGSRILEIGCGQGDMTAVLADAVGTEGHVTAVDLASPEYGAPVSLGRSAEYLMSMPLGEQIEFRFEYDVLDPANHFDDDTFDYVVVSHCSWYFASLDQLRRVLIRVRPWAKRLCYSEWDMEPRSLDQMAHLLSVLIQGQVESYKAESVRNVRTPCSRPRLKRLLEEAGWRLATESVMDSALLQDGGWEIEECLGSAARDADSLNLPAKLREFVGSQLDLLKALSERDNNRSLHSYAILAERA